MWYYYVNSLEVCKTDKGGWWQRLLFVGNLTGSEGG